VAASRQRGDILLGTRDRLGCSNAKYVFGWKGLDEAEIKSHLKYARTAAQAERFVKTKMTMTMNSSICHGCVQWHVTGEPNVSQMCSSSKTAGKTEQGEINWIWPYADLEPTVHWMLERTVRDGGVSFPRTGETYPGFDICKLCPFLVWTKPKQR
jgi:uncharacterized protein (DUF169 family)